MGINVIIFRVDMSSYADIDNKNKDILISGERPLQGLDDIHEQQKLNILSILHNQEKKLY